MEVMPSKVFISFFVKINSTSSGYFLNLDNEESVNLFHSINTYFKLHLTIRDSNQENYQKNLTRLSSQTTLQYSKPFLGWP